MDIRATSTYQHYNQEYEFPEGDPKRILCVTELNGYRPVALTSVIMKCFDRLVKDHITSTLPATLDPLQFDYRSNRSTDKSIAITPHTALSHLDKRNTYVRMLFIVYRSAFNTIEPSKLIIKMTQIESILWGCITAWYGDCTALNHEGSAVCTPHHRGQTTCPPGHLQHPMSQEGQKGQQSAIIQKARLVQVRGRLIMIFQSRYRLLEDQKMTITTILNEQ